MAKRNERPLVLIAPRLTELPRSICMPEPLAPEEAIADCFVDAIMAAGGVPLLMALTDDDAVLDCYLGLADGVAIPGGQDVDPRLWGDERPYDQALLCPPRDAFEVRLVRRALELDLPLFTTCRGTQVMNVALGGSLCMNVAGLEPREGMALWRHQAVLHDPVHPVEVEEGSLLWSAVGGSALVQANSSHHCCVERLGEGVRLCGRATDGVPEAIEVEGHRFALGVQWHPEYTWRTVASDLALWRAFVEACAQTR